MHRWPALVIRISSSDFWFLTSSCWLRSRAIQQFNLSIGQTGLHLPRRPCTLNPRSSRTLRKPLALPSESTMVWVWPQSSITGFVSGIMVSCWIRCAPPSLTFMSNGLMAFGPRDACAEDWSNISNACLPGCSQLNSVMNPPTCSISCSVSHHLSWPEPGNIILRASLRIFPSVSRSTSRPVLGLIKSETWINRPRPLLRGTIPPAGSLYASNMRN